MQTPYNFENVGKINHYDDPNGDGNITAIGTSSSD